jgi:hypothetical protein
VRLAVRLRDVGAPVAQKALNSDKAESLNC